MNELTIRQAQESDIPLIIRFIRELAAYENLEAEVVTTEEILREWIFEKQRAEVIIGEVQGEPVGYALFFYNFSTFLGRAGIYLEDLYVRPQYRSCGYGKLLLKAVARLCLERGCGRFEWACLDWNKSSIAFYRSMGAVPMDEWTIYRVTGEPLAALSDGAPDVT